MSSITAILPAHNEEGCLEETIKSLRGQSVLNHKAKKKEEEDEQRD